MHLISPINFRAGKTFPWKNNILLQTDKTSVLAGGGLSLTAGLERFSNHLLQRYRIFTVRGVIRFSLKTNTLVFNLLYIPRIKQTTFENFATDADSIFEWLYASRELGPLYLKQVYLHFWNVYNKTVKLEAEPHIRLNKWISIRMFRGSRSLVWSTNKNLGYKKGYFLNRRWIKLKLNFRSRYRSGILNTNNTKNLAIFSDQTFTHELTSIIKRKIKVKTLNVFTYFVKKGIMTYKNHQRHFWYQAFRGRRWSYANYWDIVNAFYIIGTIQNSEIFLINVLKLVFPQITNFRRIFYFLDAVIKNLPQIYRRFSCFRVIITGKLKGGTKRTRHITIGYGRLAINTLSKEAFNNFMPFAHKYGAFGVRFIMCRNLLKI